MAAFLAAADIVITCVFTLELSLKCIALGLAAHSGAYLRGSWNRLDAFIVFVSWLSIAIASSDLGALRALRALRPRAAR